MDAISFDNSKLRQFCTVAIIIANIIYILRFSTISRYSTTVLYCTNYMLSNVVVNNK